MVEREASEGGPPPLRARSQGPGCGLTIGAWQRLRGETPEEAWDLLAREAARVARRCESSEIGWEDIAQELLARVISASHPLAGAPPAAPLEAWLAAIVRRVAHDMRRAMGASRRAAGQPTVRQPRGSRHAPPAEERPTLNDDRTLARRLLARLVSALPPPYAQILALRGLLGASHASVARYLSAWRNVSSGWARELEREALKMARAVLAGQDPARLWPRRFSSKNPWKTTPPPAFLTH